MGRGRGSIAVYYCYRSTAPKAVSIVPTKATTSAYNTLATTQGYFRGTPILLDILSLAVQPAGLWIPNMTNASYTVASALNIPPYSSLTSVLYLWSITICLECLISSQSVQLLIMLSTVDACCTCLASISVAKLGNPTMRLPDYVLRYQP